MDELELATTVRAFVRFSAESIGSLDDHHEGIKVSPAQARVLFMVSTMEPCSVNDLAEWLQLDLAYTSRVLGALEDASMVRRTIAAEDRRRRVVAMTGSGRRLLREVERHTNERVLALVGHLDAGEIDRLLQAMATIETLLTTPSPTDNTEN